MSNSEYAKYLCETDDFAGSRFYFGQYGEIATELPDTIEVAREVDGFQFILEDIVANSEAYQYDMAE